MAILIVEDEEGIVAFVRQGLEAAGYGVLVAREGEAGARLARSEGVELVVLDLGLPGLPGEEVLRQIRAHRPRLPVIILTAKDALADRVASLNAGADDYMVKPFSFSELLARIRARLRGQHQAKGAVLEAGGVCLDLRTREVTVAGETASLSAREHALLEVLMRNPGHVLSQTQLLDQVWGYDFDGASNVVEVYVRNLRRKIGAERIETLRGAGYRLRA